MPFYVWSCANVGCSAQVQTFEHRCQPVTPECPEGHGEMERDWHGEARKHRPGSAWPMTTSHLTGKPETFNSQKELDQRCKELGMVQRDDSAFLNKRYEGYDIRTGKQKHSEGSGRGNPGQWV